ncbi:MAG: hypothetical protein AAGG68_27675 [Bacteroidota bacterium]
MAYKKIEKFEENGDNQGIFYGQGMGPSSTCYFHLKDLDELKTRHSGAVGFRVVNGRINGTDCAILIMVESPTSNGANVIHDKIDDYVAFSCPKIRDTIGGVPYDSLPDEDVQ